METVINVNNETHASMTRTTKDGRKITYQMNVVQQPERARACGQGAKSSTDRRPVDPPPILDLRILEGEGSNAIDVTVSYKATFFAWASLEQARPIAQGRITQANTNTPVLCGSPVAGISYLDRPKPAGYFIFPDLSVRHEGKYRLNFTLFEDLKDASLEDSEPRPSPVEGGTPDCVHGRLQIRTLPFTVFSAKKFPGLQESTPLSRMVADQGCRVRIRRDVRMRRHREKNARDWDDYEDQTTDQRQRMQASPMLDRPNYPTPPPGSVHHSRAPSGEPQARPRSSSMVSNASVHQQSIQPSPSNEWAPPQDVGSVYPPSPHYYRPPVSSNEATSVVPYPAPQYTSMAHTAQPMPAPQMNPYPLNGPPAWGYQPSPQMHSPNYGPQVNHLRQTSMSYVPTPQDYQMAQGPPQYSHDGHPAGALAVVDNSGYGRPIYTPSQLSPSQLYPSAQQASVATNQSNFSTDLPPLRPRGSYNSFDRATPTAQSGNLAANPSPYMGQPPPPQYVSDMPAGVAPPKRSFGTVFNTQHIDQPLRSGARPDVLNAQKMTNGLDGPTDPNSSDDESMDLERLKMEYRRADGTKVQRRWPTGS